LKHFLLYTSFLLIASTVTAQNKGFTGILTGNVIGEKEKAVEGCTVSLIKMGDSLIKYRTITDKLGEFKLVNLTVPGYYSLSISYVGKADFRLDSIHFRTERFDFNISDIILKDSSLVELSQVVVYAERPLMESKEGNLTFNVTESANAAGSTASELLTQVPLVAKDADGKITVRGKEPRILIDDKPVELNLQQLQDLLESMPGSSIEKIEVMTNPPPQYANEQGGVINIVMRKGKVGRSGRVALSAGTRSEYSLSGNFAYRKRGLSISVNAGFAINYFKGEGNSTRRNLYLDSANYFNTISSNTNRNKRPNSRVNVDYEFSKKSLLNLVIQFNQNNSNQHAWTRFSTLNRFDSLWKLSERTISSTIFSINPNFNINYTYKPRSGETYRFFLSFNPGRSTNDKDFFQSYLKTGNSFIRADSAQRQETENRLKGGSFRVAYDRTIPQSKLSISAGAFYNQSWTRAVTDAYYQKLPADILLPLPLLSNDFIFKQEVYNVRSSIKKILGEEFSVTAGVATELTLISFDMKNENKNAANSYLSWLPFANLNKSWKDRLSLTISYRRSINRPGMNQINPVIDFSDPYNLRFGNPDLIASTADHFNLVVSRTRKSYFLNLSAGYHEVKGVFSQVRTLVDLGKTEITWENISGRHEYELSTWNGLTLVKKLKLNASASWTYMQYSPYDKEVRKFRNGFSLTTTIGQNWVPNEFWNLTTNFNLNRFASPQGVARWNSSLTVGVQRKFFTKRLLVTLNAVDPIMNQQRRNVTYGPNFSVTSFNMTYTRNYRLTLAYVFMPRRPSTPINKKKVTNSK
jgi:outer membrane receptor protein involved in Fe transport